MGHGPFIGRVNESGQLDAWLAEAAGAGAVTVLLSGDPGVGKSQLLERFAETAVASGALVLSGSCISLGAGEIPYAPLIEALRLLVREHSDDVAGMIGGPAWSEMAGLTAAFTGSDAPAVAPGSQLRVFGAVLRLLAQIGTDRPVVLIFEDVHWADPSTLDLIAYLTRVKSNERMMLVCSYRSGLAQGHPLRTMLAEPEFTRRAHRLALSGFTRSEMREFLNAGTPEPIDRDRVQYYYDLSDGNPFFAELLLAANHPTDRTGAAPVPESLTEIMSALIAQLSDDALGVLQVAATAGRRVSDHLLAAVGGRDDRSLDRALRECIDRQILVANPMDETYAFRHSLLRETVYQNVSPRQRRSLHAAMAETLAATDDASASAAAELAYHWFEAGRSAEALASAVRAGGIAVRMRAFQEAETQYRRALELWSHVTDAQGVAGVPRQQVLAMAADAARWAGHMQQAVQWAQSAVDGVDLRDDPSRAGELFERLGSYQWEAGEIEESVLAYQQAHRWLADRPPSAVAARVLATLATAALRAGELIDGLQRAQSAMAMAEQVGARAEYGRALNSAGLALSLRGEHDDGVALLREALYIAGEVEHLEDLFRAYGNLGVALECAGAVNEAADVLLDGLAQARALGLLDARQGGVLANNASAALFALGRWDEAVTLLDEVLVDRPVKESIYLRLTRAEIAVARGQFARAERLLAAIRTHPNHDPRFVGLMYICLVESAIWQGNLDGAQTTLARAVQAVTESNNVQVRLQLCTVGLRAYADEAGLPAANSAADEKARVSAEELVEVSERTAGEHPDSPEILVLTRLCRAERGRADGIDTAAQWAEIAIGWSELDRAYPAAYARWRQAEAAMRTSGRRAAEGPARAAHATAVRLAAEPLRSRIAAFASRHRVDLIEHPAQPAAEAMPTRPYDRYGLTEREVVVLRQLCEGRSNRMIGQRLHIAESTVSVHVTHILRKLDVHARTEAAALANGQRFFAE